MHRTCQKSYQINVAFGWLINQTYPPNFPADKVHKKISGIDVNANPI